MNRSYIRDILTNWRSTTIPYENQFWKWNKLINIWKPQINLTQIEQRAHQNSSNDQNLDDWLTCRYWWMHIRNSLSSRRNMPEHLRFLQLPMFRIRRFPLPNRYFLFRIYRSTFYCVLVKFFSYWLKSSFWLRFSMPARILYGLGTWQDSPNEIPFTIFHWQIVYSSLDIDECGIVPEICLNGATCTNSPGTYSCACQVGYTGQLCQNSKISNHNIIPNRLN